MGTHDPDRSTPTLEDAIALAARAHHGQRDKAGQPYILHVLRVMLRLHDDDPQARIVAVLHDVLEDTPTTLADLRRAGYDDEICEAVDRLTRRAEESYEAMIDRVVANPLARRVKLADLEDNLDAARVNRVPEDAAPPISRYRAALERLRREAGGHSKETR